MTAHTMEITTLNDIKPMHSNKTIKARVYRKWTAMNHYFRFIEYNEVEDRADVNGTPLIGVNLPFVIWNEQAEGFDMVAYAVMPKPIVIAVSSTWATRRYGGARFTTEATILEIIAPNGWYCRKYAACNIKVGDDSSTSHCQDHGPQPIPNYGYCFRAVVNDETATTSITCFSPEAHTFVPECNAVVAALNNQETEAIHAALKQVENKTYIFQYHFGKRAAPGNPSFTLDTVFKTSRQPLLTLPATELTTPLPPEIEREGSSSTKTDYQQLQTEAERKDSKAEVRTSLQKMGRNKAVGPDQIPIEAWKSLGDEVSKRGYFAKALSNASMIVAKCNNEKCDKVPM
nr:hypothetical protein [Tanacetum cinerariifolium]